MAEHLNKIKCGDKIYSLSRSGKDVYFSSTSTSGGMTLKGAQFINNEIKINGEKASDFQICQAIKK